MRTKSSISAAWAVEILSALRRQDVDVDQIVHELPMLHEQTLDPNGYIPLACNAKLLEVAANITDDPCFSVHFMNNTDLRKMGVLGYIILNSSTLGDSYRNLIRYFRIFNDGVEIEIKPEDEFVTIQYTIKDSAVAAKLHQRLFCASFILHVARQSTERDLHPTRVDFRLARSEGVGDIDRQFGATVRWEAGRDAIVAPREWLTLPVINADQGLLYLLETYAQDLLREHTVGMSFAEEVRNWIIKQMPCGRLDIEGAAADLGISPKTLSRRLTREGTTYRRIVDDVRAKLAVEYLKNDWLSLEKISYLLGYSDPTTLTHAFQRWHACSPRDYRIRIAVPQHQN